MDNAASIIAQCPGESGLTQLGPEGEHVAVLGLPGGFGLLRRRKDLLDEGVAAVFGLVGEEAHLLGLCFDAEQFSPAGAAKWLAERGLKPLLFVPNSARLAAADFDAPLPAQVGRAVSGNSTKGGWRW